VLATAGALALAGCSSSGGSKPGGLGGSTTGSSTGGAGSGTTYKIGFEGPLTGDNKQLGINEVNAVNLAVDQANNAGTLPFKLQVLQSDDLGTPAGAPTAAAALLQDPLVLGVIGPSFSGATTAVGAKYAAAGLALISPSATNATLTSQGFKTFHRIVPTDGVEGKATADFLATKFKSVFVVDDTSTYGKGVGDVVRAELKAKASRSRRRALRRRPTTAQSQPRWLGPRTRPCTTAATTLRQVCWRRR
jgi:branched-chain amino acid transport system substrate-binding protein